ncbi:MAG: [LysW]-lysine hydrolase [Phycisphaerales bacterium]|nr:[LysW]-lysine hydrolase [Phycisphaerales bacterium]
MTLDDTEQLLFDLVSTPSISGDERSACAVFLRHAKTLGFETETDEVHNAIAHRGATGSEAEVHLVLLGHIDTVPGEIPVRIEDGVLHGRGSVDAKGPLCAMLAAASRAELPHGVRVTVAGAVGEEADSPGARVLRDRYTPDACIIAEPSGWDGVTLGYKGILVIRAQSDRDLSHTAGPECSATDNAVRWWNGVQSFCERYNITRDRVFDTIQYTIRDLHTGNDGLRERATMKIALRLPVDVDPEGLFQQLGVFLPDGVSIKMLAGESAYLTMRNDPVVRAISGGVRAAGGSPRPKLKTGTADLNVVAPVWGCPIAAYGPGDSLLDHTPQERLELEEYRRSIRVLTHAIESLCSELLENKRSSLLARG